MVYDLGGGTFDVSVIEIGDDVIEVLATSGDNHLGGDDFDERVAAHLLDAFKREHGVDLRGNQAAMQRVTEAAREAKKELSSLDTAHVNLPFLAQGPSGPLHLEATLTRAAFNDMTRDLVERTSGPVQTALNDAGVGRVRAGLRAAGGRLHAHSGRSGPCAQAHGQGAVRVHQPRRVGVAMGAAIQGATPVRHVDGPGEGR